MNKTNLITSILLCFLYIGTSWGAEISLFEQDFLRNKGKKDTYEENFTAHEGEARLIISNGDEDGKNKVKRIAVFLNGKKIKKLSRLMKKNPRQEITVNLLAENTLSVKLAGKRQGHLKVQVVQDVDTDASSSVDVTLFDKKYLRSKGRPHAFQDSFVAQEHQARLIITNGGESGGKKVSSASVVLNGKEIVGPRDFNQKVSVQEFTVDLLEENSITLKMASKPGSSLHVQVVQEVEAAAAAVIGPEGGVVAVEDTESPIYGAKIEVPAGALDEDIVLTMKEKDSTETVLPEKLMHVGPIVDFGPDGTQFQSNVIVTLPYNDHNNDGYLDGTGIHENNVFPGFHDNGASEWDYPEKIAQNTTNNTDEFEINHFSEGTQLVNKRMKLGVVYELIKGRFTDDVKKDIKLIKQWIASCDDQDKDCTSRNNDGTHLDLAVQSTVSWMFSYPSQIPTQPDEKINASNFIAFENYARYLKKEKVKWTPLLSILGTPDQLGNDRVGNEFAKDVIKIAVPCNPKDDDECEEESKDFLIASQCDPTNETTCDLVPFPSEAGMTVTCCDNDLKLKRIRGSLKKKTLTSFNFHPDSKIWQYVEGWVKGFVDAFSLDEKDPEKKGYFGNTIEEIFICNEMSFAPNIIIENYPEDINRLDMHEKLSTFLLDMRMYVINALKEKEITGVKVGWKYNPYTFNNIDAQYTGLTDSLLEDLFNQDTSPSSPNLLGLDIYEGTSNKEFKETDTAKGVSGYPDAARGPAVQLDIPEKFPSLQGGIYFTEYNANVHGRGFFEADELKNFILTTEQELNVPYWTYFKWNGPDNGHETGAITEDQIIGLCNTFDELSGTTVPKHLDIFTDVKKCDPYKDAIKEMQRFGIIEGYPDPDNAGKRIFKPDALIDRAEFAKVLVLTAEKVGITFPAETQESNFPDVPKGEWFADDVNKLVSKNIIQGYEDGTFRPLENINMVEMLKMIANTFSITNAELPRCDEIDTANYEYSIPWFKEFIERDKGVIKPILRSSDWASVDIPSCMKCERINAGDTQEERDAKKEKCDDLLKPHPHYYLYGQKIQRRKAVKAIYDAYCYHCKKNQDKGTGGCESYADMCPSESGEENE